MSSQTVTGLRFERLAPGAEANRKQTATDIFFPTLNLEISNGGRAYRVTTPVTSLLGHQAIAKYAHEVALTQLRMDLKHVQELVAAADKAAQTEVKVPIDLVQQINSLVDEKNPAHNQKIEKLIKAVFSAIK